VLVAREIACMPLECVTVRKRCNTAIEFSSLYTIVNRSVGWGEARDETQRSYD